MTSFSVVTLTLSDCMTLCENSCVSVCVEEIENVSDADEEVGFFLTVRHSQPAFGTQRVNNSEIGPVVVEGVL